MNVVVSQAAEIAIRSLEEQDRLKIQVWLDHLRKWERDPVVRKQAQKLPSTTNVYLLKTSKDGLRIFFQLEPDEIKILDIASKSTILQFSE